MGKIGAALKIASLFFKPLKILTKGGKKIRRTRRAVNIGAGFMAGRAIYKNKGKKEDSDFNEKYSDFMKYAKTNNVPKEYYDDFNSKYSSNLDYTERIKNSLDIVERMRDDKAINKREYSNLKDRLYSDFKDELEEYSPRKSIEDYLPLAASILFLCSSAFLLTPSSTGLAMLNNMDSYKMNISGIVCFLLGIAFFGLFAIRMKTKK